MSRRVRSTLSHRSVALFAVLLCAATAARAQTLDVVQTFPGEILQDDLFDAGDGQIYGLTDARFFRVTPSGAVTTLYTFPTQEPRVLIRSKDGNFYGLSFVGK